MSPQDFFPDLAPWVAQLDDVFPGRQIKPYFAQWQVLHLLTLAVLGGASILLNLRLLGAGLTEEAPARLERSLRPWMHLGVFGVIISGLIIGVSNAERLYTSEAFTAKMVAMTAGIVLTYGAAMAAARADGRMGRGAAVAGAAGLAIWALSLWIFGRGQLINPGIWHMLTAAALIVLFVARGRLRWIYLAGLVALIVAQFVTTHLVIPPDDFARLDPANKAFAWIFAAWIFGLAAVQILRGGQTDQGGAFTKVVAYAGILAWVTTAAAGRWIAFA